MFKCLQFIDEMIQQLDEELQIISEADEMPMDEEMGSETENGDEMGGGETPAPEEGGDMGGETPEAPTESDIVNVEQARTLLKALSLAQPNEQIPQEFQAITPENAAQITQFVKAKLAINDDEFGTELNNI